MAKKQEQLDLWAGIGEKDFIDTTFQNIEDAEMGEFNYDQMLLYSANVNYARQLVRLSDSLTPVKRRILYSMYKIGAVNGNKVKSAIVTGNVMTIHPHGDGPTYAAMVAMTQPWKNSIPYVYGDGSFGVESSDEIYSAARYTEVYMSKYAYDCFFRDFDEECVHMIESSVSNKMEPVSLPSRYPNMLINGGKGIAVGNAFCIPPYNVEDIIRETKRLLYHPDSGPVYMVPDFPTRCDIVDDPGALKRICETGEGSLRMRGHTEIFDDGKYWRINVSSMPWGTSFVTFTRSLAALTKKGELPIKDVMNRAKPYVIKGDFVKTRSPINFDIIIDKAHDPYSVLEKIYKKTDLDKTVKVDFKVVLEELKIGKPPKMGLRELILSWIDERREYKRRLLNKRINQVTARIDLLKILIELLSPGNLESVVKLIRNSNTEECVRTLVSKYGMNSFQAGRVAATPLNAFTKDARVRYMNELKDKEEELKQLYTWVRSEKYIDDVIADELNELRQYIVPRRSEVISLETGKTMDTVNDYHVIITKNGFIKKILAGGPKGYGSFGQLDYPTHVVTAKNQDFIFVADSFGKYSCIQVGSIDTMELSNTGVKAYNYTKLEGEIISASYFPSRSDNDYVRKSEKTDLCVVTISKDGYIKKTLYDEFAEQSDGGLKQVKNARIAKVRKNDFISYVGFHLNDTNLLVYTDKGYYAYIRCDDIPVCGRDAVGNIGMDLIDGDACKGCCVVNTSAEYVVMVTAKGCVKKVELPYIGEPNKRRHSSYLATLDVNDKLVYVDTPVESISVCTRMQIVELKLDDIRTLSRKAKPVKKIGIASGDNIIRVVTN